MNFKDERPSAVEERNDENPLNPPPFECCYNMQHESRGVALIFNQEKFVNQCQRWGTHFDRDRLLDTFTKLGFNVRIYENQTKSQILNILKEVAAEDHSNSDCLIITFLTHGEIKQFNNNAVCDTILNHDMISYLHTFDGLISVRCICDHFTDEHCPSLTNKPRIFFIQACQDVKNSCDVNEIENVNFIFDEFSVLQKDFLIAFSSMPGEKSFRTTGNGSWYIEALCKEFNERGNIDDLMHTLTRVSCRIAYDYESFEFDIQQKKQMPCVVSRLTKMVFFSEKQKNVNISDVPVNQNVNIFKRIFNCICCF